jgi:hypothetical protein
MPKYILCFNCGDGCEFACDSYEIIEGTAEEAVARGAELDTGEVPFGAEYRTDFRIFELGAQIL